MMLSNKILGYRKQYEENRYLFIPSDEMCEIARNLGCTNEDMRSIRELWDNLVSDPTLSYRLSRNGRYLIDYDLRQIFRLEQQGFRLSKEDDFIRHDSDKVRHFATIENELQNNSVFRALILFKSLIIEGMYVDSRPKLHKTDKRWISTVFALRTITNDNQIGEPAAEGVHSDGVEHTMTTFLNSSNMKSTSAVSKIYNNGKPSGYDANEASKINLVSRFQHKKFLDTLFIVDSERKHSVSGLIRESNLSDAKRDMLILFTRRPCTPEHHSWELDSQVISNELPFELKISTSIADQC